MHKAILLLVTLASWAHSSAMAEEKTKDKVNELRQQGYTVQAISPIFSQLVMMSFPKGFKTASESTKGNQYIREAVLEGETLDQWSEMITVTGAKGLAANPNMSAKSFIEGLAGSFKRACPDTFSAKAIGALKISGQDAFAALASCGTVQSRTTKHSESAMLIGIKGAADYYTIQWAERGPASSQPLVQDEAKWQDRFKKLNPIKVCPRVPGEAAPYPSCIGQK
jgi:hypothetical protein